RLSEKPEDRLRRLVGAASSALDAGLPGAAAELVEQAADEDAGETSETTRIVHVRGRIEMWSGAPLAAADHLLSEAVRIQRLDPSLALLLLRDAAMAALLSGQMRRATAAADMVAD